MRLVRFADNSNGFGFDAEESRCELAGRIRILAIDNRRGCRDADRIPSFAAAERPETTDQTRRLGALRARERVRLVEDEEVEPSVREQLDVPLARQQQLELFHVGEQDPRLAAGCSHHLARADLFGRVDAFAVLLLLERRLIVRAR